MAYSNNYTDDDMEDYLDELEIDDKVSYKYSSKDPLQKYYNFEKNENFEGYY